MPGRPVVHAYPALELATVRGHSVWGTMSVPETSSMTPAPRALAAAAGLICFSAPALAGGQLAVGEVIPLSPPRPDTNSGRFTPRR